MSQHAGAIRSPLELDAPNVLVDTAEIPGGGELRLFRRGDRFEIMFGGEQLMGSWASRSEKALATLVAERLGKRARRVLIGGLGMGFTLGAALATMPAETSIVVAELVPGVASWATGPLAEVFAGSLADPRVSLVIRDVHDVVVEQCGAFDGILLDVDNGPDGLITPGNERLYCDWGLRALRAALRPGGVLAVWSAHPDDPFTARLAQTGFAVEVREVATGRRLGSPPHTIWLAVRQG